MMPGTYTYDPAGIQDYGKDRMRFELGDTAVESGEATCALCDEEYLLLTDGVKTGKEWKKAKLKCIESIFRRMAYEADTKVGPLSLSLTERAKLWQDEYEKLKAEIKRNSVSAAAVGALTVNGFGNSEFPTPPYFYAGMMSTEESEGGDI